MLGKQLFQLHSCKVCGALTSMQNIQKTIPVCKKCDRSCYYCSLSSQGIRCPVHSEYIISPPERLNEEDKEKKSHSVSLRRRKRISPSRKEYVKSRVKSKRSQRSLRV